MRVTTSLIPNQSVALKHLWGVSVAQIANVTATGTSDGSGAGIPRGTALSDGRDLCWLFDLNGAAPVYLTTEPQAPLAPAAPCPSVRIELLRCMPFADNGYAGGIVQVINQMAGTAAPANWNEVALWQHCADASTRAHDANYWSAGVFNALAGGGYGWSVVKFPAPAPNAKHDIVLEFTTPGTWGVWVDGVTQSLLSVAANNLASVGDGAQIVNLGTPATVSGGVFARTLNTSFYGTLRGANLFLSAAAGVQVATGQYRQMPAITNKQAQAAAQFNAYMYDAQYTVHGAGAAELYAPNLFTAFAMDPQHLYYGGNSTLGSCSASAPARVWV